MINEKKRMEQDNLQTAGSLGQAVTGDLGNANTIGICPSCGYCPCCGRRNQETAFPYISYVPYMPSYPSIYTTSNTITTTSPTYQGQANAGYND